MQKFSPRQKQTAHTKERKEVQNSLDQAREEVIQHDLSVKRGETAPTAIMREILSRTLTVVRNRLSAVKPVIRSRHGDNVDPYFINDVDEELNAACADIANLDLDDVMDLSKLVIKDEDE